MTRFTSCGQVGTEKSSSPNDNFVHTGVSDHNTKDVTRRIRPAEVSLCPPKVTSMLVSVKQKGEASAQPIPDLIKMGRDVHKYCDRCFTVRASAPVQPAVLCRPRCWF